MRSWTAALPTPTDPADVGRALQHVTPNSELGDEQTRQLDAAKEAAAAIAAAGVVGDLPVVVSLSGAANPHHVPGRDGATRSCVAISVIQASTPDQAVTS